MLMAWIGLLYKPWAIEARNLDILDMAVVFCQEMDIITPSGSFYSFRRSLAR
jgi:hypothetical protein